MNVVVKKNQNAAEAAVLRNNAGEVRLKSVESQLSIAFTLCETAETEIRSSEHDVARKLVRKLRHHVKTISFHLEERSYPEPSDTAAPQEADAARKASKKSTHTFVSVSY